MTRDELVHDNHGGWSQWIWVAQALLLLGMILKCGLAVPYWDQFEIADFLLRARATGLNWTDLYAQHNESRFVVSRLLGWGLAQVTGWDQRAEMLLGWLMVVGTVVGVGQLVKRSHPSSVAGPLWSVVGIILLSVGQWQNLQWGFQFSLYIPLLAIVWALAVLQGSMHYPVRVGVAGLLALVSTYGFASGIAAWAVLLPAVLIAPRTNVRGRAVAAVVWVILAALTAWSYFRNYLPPSLPKAELTDHVWDAVQFLMCFLGNGLRYTQDVEGTMYTGFVGFGLLVTLGLIVIGIAAVRRDVSLLRSAMPWLTLAAWTMACGVATTSGRLALGIEQSRPPRYVGFALPMWAALPPLFYLAAAEITRRRPWFDAKTGALVLGAMLIGVQLAGIPLARGEVLTWRNDRAEGAAASAMSQAVMNPKDMVDRVYPVPLRAQQLIEQLSVRGLMRVKVLPAEAGRDARPFIGEAGKRFSGEVTSVKRKGDLCSVTGWARLRGEAVETVAIGVREGDGRIRLVGSTVHTKELGPLPPDGGLKPFYWTVSLELPGAVRDEQLVALVYRAETGKFMALPAIAAVR